MKKILKKLIFIFMFFFASSIDANTNIKNICIIVTPLANVNGSQQEADIATHRLRGSLNAEITGRIPACDVSEANSAVTAYDVTVTARGEYIARGSGSSTENPEFMLVVRLYSEENVLLKTFQGTWFKEVTMQQEINRRSQEITSFLVVYFSQELKRRADKSGVIIKKDAETTEKKQSCKIKTTLGFGYVQPVGRLNEIAAYGVGTELSIGSKDFLSSLYSSDRITLRAVSGYVRYEPATITVQSLHSIYLKVALGYDFSFGNLSFIPLAGVGQQFSIMSHDDRDPALQPYQYTTGYYFQPLVYSALEIRYSFRSTHLFILPQTVIFNDGGVAGVSASFYGGVGTTFTGFQKGGVQ
ncbi:MAG: hypothetical protein PF637_09910 [Spirochaetes bacterium]|jgi:hypothetical protein|nr:hypothetical protein [Spirochaetota bacterium]